jgi:hypothetical protein
MLILYWFLLINISEILTENRNEGNNMFREGTLYYDASIGRYDICFNSGGCYGGLHCGDCFEVHMSGIAWMPARIEYDGHGGWYLSGFNESPEYVSDQGFPVRI